MYILSYVCFGLLKGGQLHTIHVPRHLYFPGIPQDFHNSVDIRPIKLVFLLPRCSLAHDVLARFQNDEFLRKSFEEIMTSFYFSTLWLNELTEKGGFRME